MRHLRVLGLLLLATTLQASELRVLVYNIHAGKDAAAVPNLARVASIIKQNQADIVLLQEVDRRTQRSGNIDQLAELMRLTAMHGVYGRALDFQGGEYGIAMLSRWPFDRSETVSLRAGGSIEPRVAMTAITNGIRVINTHFDASDDDTWRMQEVQQFLGVLARHSSLPVIAGGDLNSTPDSRVIERIRASGWRDVWTECGEGAELTYPADKPVKRIDYLLLSPPWRCLAAQVIDSAASDHRPVFFHLALRKPIGVKAAAIQWRDAPPNLPAGTKIAVLEGNPQSEGIFTIRLQVPARAALPLHTHPADERVTVLSGLVEVTVEGQKKRYSAGDFYVTPAGMPHAVSFPDRSVIQITGVGPWTVKMVAPDE